MTDFILKNYTILTKGVIILCSLIGLLVFRNHRNFNTRFFIYYLWFVLLIEVVASYPTYLLEFDFLEPIKAHVLESRFRKNYWWYALTWNVFGVLLVLNYIYRLLKNQQFKTIVKYIMIGFPIIALILISTKLDLFFNGFIVGLILIAGAIILFSVTLYVIDVLSNDRILELKGSFSLIVLGALFIWWLVVTPIVFFQDYYHPRDPGYRRLRPLILFFSNIFMYLSFAVAFLFCKPQNH